MISHLIAYYRQRRAMKRLAELCAQTLASYEHKRYIAYRRAALKGRGKVGA